MLIPQGCAINLIFYLHFDQIYSGPRPKFCPTSFCGHFRLFVFFYKNPFIWSKRKIIWVKLWLLKSSQFRLLLIEDKDQVLKYIIHFLSLLLTGINDIAFLLFCPVSGIGLFWMSENSDFLKKVLFLPQLQK